MAGPQCHHRCCAAAVWHLGRRRFFVFQMDDATCPPNIQLTARFLRRSFQISLTSRCLYPYRNSWTERGCRNGRHCTYCACVPTDGGCGSENMRRACAIEAMPHRASRVDGDAPKERQLLLALQKVGRIPLRKASSASTAVASH